MHNFKKHASTWSIAITLVVIALLILVCMKFANRDSSEVVTTPKEETEMSVDVVESTETETGEITESYVGDSTEISDYVPTGDEDMIDDTPSARTDGVDTSTMNDDDLRRAQELVNSIMNSEEVE